MMPGGTRDWSGVGKVEPGGAMVGYRPWSTVNYSDTNTNLLRKYEQGVLTFIMANPGVTLVSNAQV